jgi:HTH-type transcriptional regulator/antitoxin MqsA
MYKNGDTCPVCGSGTIRVEKRPETFEYKGQSLTLELTVYLCDVCEESFFDNKEMKKYQRAIKDFQRRVDGLLTSTEIKQIREKYGISQRELASILGIAEKSIAKYEAGFVAQSKAMDNLLRIIEKFPDVLKYLKQLNIVQVPPVNFVKLYEEGSKSHAA